MILKSLHTQNCGKLEAKSKKTHHCLCRVILPHPKRNANICLKANFMI
ncbi:hypothetical protein MNBD_ALPHA11-1863 [hydrothermal vent metagenome]|uniref:Uncharacterized protein n=1 Tax=hydrothermal vent metagenome TaxID=652676 RepID=A0A3B0UFS9_9ZZZZ